MIRKTQSLAYPANPLDAMRELQELDAPTPKTAAPAVAAKTLPGELPTGSEVGSATSSEVAPAHGSDVAHATGSAEARATGSAVGGANGDAAEARPLRRPARTREPVPAEAAPGAGENPVASAMREMLGKPYTFDEKRGPFTVSTVKIPTEVWARLGWAATLTERPKQEIISEALKDYFARLVGRR